MNFKTYLENHIVLFDGAMGTQIQQLNLPLGQVPEQLNLDQKHAIEKIHTSYVSAGAKVVSTNTFGASPYKLKAAGLSVEDVITSAVQAAQKSGAYVALDLGPTGRMMQPIGDMTFDEAYASYCEQIKYGQDADLILIETMSDLSELRAAILAAKEQSNLPVVVSMTFQEDGRTLTGVTPEAFVYTVEALGVDGLGVNCSLGPDALYDIVRRITAIASVAVIVQANAGLPVVKNNKTTFSFTPEKYCDYIESFLALGVRMIGGCCGTSPAHIAKMATIIEGKSPQPLKSPGYRVCSQTQIVDFDDFVIIGERINPTGNKALKSSLKTGDIDLCMREGILQCDQGAKILDVNVGLPGIDEVKTMTDLVDHLVTVVDVPLQIDSSKSKVLSAGLRHFPGVGIINSVNGKQKSMDKIFPIAKQYGAFVVCLTMDENGIPSDYRQRLAIAEKIIAEAKKYGIVKERLIIDALVLTVSAQQQEVMETIKTIEGLQKLQVKTTLGISNVSYGMPNRPLLTRTFATLGLAAGLTSAIMDPTDQQLKNTLLATQVLLNQDRDGQRYIEKVTEIKQAAKIIEHDLYHLVVKGYSDQVASWTREALKTKSPLEIVNTDLIPTLDRIGQQFEEKTLFLPQLIRAAETIGSAFDLIKATLASGESTERGTIVMATVRGDVHDIGKNLVKILLENYGYKIIDLGRDVPQEAVLEAVVKHDVKLVGLSALMTTTVVSMQETIALLHREVPDVKVFVGGAVLTTEYAAAIGADFYCKDAKMSVNVAEAFFNKASSVG